MSFVISLVLACTTILATFMLQLCDDSPNSTGTLMSVLTFFSILTALYFVDYKRVFSISRTVCNILIVLAVVGQLGTLVKSREDFLAFLLQTSSRPCKSFFSSNTRLSENLTKFYLFRLLKWLLAASFSEAFTLSPHCPFTQS